MRRKPGKGRLAVAIFLLLAGATSAHAQFSLESKRPPVEPPPPPAQAAPVAPVSPTVPVVPPATATNDIPPRLREAVAGLDARYATRVTLLSRERREGLPSRVAGDTLWLAEGGGIALVEIARLEQMVPAIRHGSRWVTLTGVLLGGIIGGSIGASLDDINAYDSPYNDESDRAEAIIIGAAMGMAVLGVPAAAIGGHAPEGRDAWYTLYPPGLVGAPPEYTQQNAGGVERRRRDPRRRARLLVETGWSSGTNGPLASSGAGYSATLLTRLTPSLEYGPSFSFHAFETVIDVPARTTSADMTVIPPFVSLNFDMRGQSTARGARPWFDGGVGVCLSSEMHIGAHVGSGYRWRDAHGRDYGLFVRRQIPFVKQEDAIGGFWTMGAGLTFGL